MGSYFQNTFLDVSPSGNPMSPGEPALIGSGCTFTIRTDSRIHANLVSGRYTGSLGNVDFTDIGGIYDINATNVRWLPFNTGGGSIPTIGTMITQGAV